jgi:deazaflavin-dependent oxidoreductase (nitroreductase family)
VWDASRVSAASFHDANALHRAMRRLGSTTAGAWFFARVLHRVDRVVFRLTGRRGTFARWASGIPVVMLTTTGAKSGVPRTSPVLGIADGDALILIASNFGRDHHPAWAHNLRAHRNATVAVDGAVRELRARELQGEERERAFRLGGKIYPGYTAYRRRASREIPVFRLEPR